ncbi:putative DNA-directed RNA polymerase subunit delta [Cocos nucifera]|uniref:Putative DNA-directed RNA polymerase subunit delta n=1 Tax=Cocos nucifera TaxID=13894 RepID=A0A8K0IQV1_COCNU|nr:putative DNA-directed RNA polymerase subunit delta [Cocos nucifera]
MEASGDSEIDLDPVTGHSIITVEEEAVVDEDDTQSCTHEPHDNIHTNHNFNNDDGVVDDDEDDANMEHERVMTWSPGEMMGLEKEGVVDSTEEDRICWVCSSFTYEFYLLIPFSSFDILKEGKKILGFCFIWGLSLAKL